MDNSIVIVVRTASGWPVANGVNDPAGRYYHRVYRGSRRYRYEGSWDTYSQALAEKLRKEQTLGPLYRPCEQALNDFIRHLSDPKTRRIKDGRAYRPKPTSECKADIKEFLAFSKKHGVSEITREDVLRWRDALQLENSTIRGKMSSIARWHRWLGGDGLLKPGDLPRQKKSRPKPYSSAEIDKQFAVAEGHEHLLLRVALASGLRKMEIATLERSDIHETAPLITIAEEKPQFAWVPKTTQGARDITIDGELWEDLLALPDGLLFPNAGGNIDVHIDRIFEAIGKRAGVKKPAGNNVGWCHRWRHTCATERIRNAEDPVTILAQMGWSDFSMIQTYAESDPENPKNLAAAERRARPAKTVGPRLVRETA